MTRPATCGGGCPSVPSPTRWVWRPPRLGRRILLRKGTSAEYGARELNRTIHRNLTQPLATMVATGNVEPGSRVRVEVAEDTEALVLRTTGPDEAEIPAHPCWWTTTATCCIS